MGRTGQGTGLGFCAHMCRIPLEQLNKNKNKLLAPRMRKMLLEFRLRLVMSFSQLLPGSSWKDATSVSFPHFVEGFDHFVIDDKNNGYIQADTAQAGDGALVEPAEDNERSKGWAQIPSKEAVVRLQSLPHSFCTHESCRATFIQCKCMP